MINPRELLDQWVELLRAIPELVEMMGGDSERIFAYHHRHADSVSLERAIHQMPSPGLMLCWEGRQLGSFSGGEVFRHSFLVTIRAGEELPDDAPFSYYQIDQLLWKGIPTGETQPMRYQVVHASCYPMEPYAIQRLSDAEGVDYFQARVAFVEKGDD